MNTNPRPDIERHFIADRTTLGTRLGTRIPTVALDERLTGSCSLVFKKPRQHAPSRVASGFREAVVRHYPLHIQFLDRDDLVFAYEPMTELVEVVTSGARHTLMRAGHQSPGSVPALRSFLLAREFALFPFQVLFRLAQMAWVGELRSVACDSKMRQPNVNPDGLSVSRYVGYRLAVVGQDRRIKLPARIAAHCDGLELADDVAVDDTLNPADFWQVDARAVDLHALRILDRLATMLRLKTRVFAALLEEILERSRQVL